MHQTISKTRVLPIPMVSSHPADQEAAYHLLNSSPTTSPNQPLLTYTHITVSMPWALIMDSSTYTACATATYRQGLDLLHIKQQGLRKGNAFLTYVTSTSAATSPVSLGMAAAV